MLKFYLMNGNSSGQFKTKNSINKKKFVKDFVSIFQKKT